MFAALKLNQFQLLEKLKQTVEQAKPPEIAHKVRESPFVLSLTAEQKAMFFRDMKL
jgi:hypothetical protein